MESFLRSRWLKGPKFPGKEKRKWPKSSQDLEEISTQDPEVRKEVTVHSVSTEKQDGPDLTSSLIGVVTRFRKEPVVIMADTESMFHQVQVPPDDRDLLRFLWWPEGDMQQPPME